LIAALEDPDDGVVTEARTGLQLLSRKIDGFGPSPFASPDQKKAAADQWRRWFNDTRPPELSDDRESAEAKPPGGPSR
jgi:hypothetical protein